MAHITALTFQDFYFIISHFQWWRQRSENLAGGNVWVWSGMSYRKQSRIRLPLHPIAPLGGSAAGGSATRGVENSTSRRSLSTCTTDARHGFSREGDPRASAANQNPPYPTGLCTEGRALDPGDGTQRVQSS